MRSVTKVIYKPDSQSTEEYTVIVDPSEKWKAGDTTIPLTEVVDSMSSAVEINVPVARELCLPLENAKKCGRCGRTSTESLKVCSGCAQIAYCGPDCQKRDWKTHKRSCGETDRIELGSFYPLIAFIMELQRNDPFKPSHRALGHQIVNSPNPWDEESVVRLPDGSASRLIILGDEMLFPTMGPAPQDWWPTALSDQVRQKLRRRFQSENFLLPSIISVLFALMAEMYTTTSTVNPSDGAKRRARLSYYGSPIADFGIAKGQANVKHQDHFTYLFLNHGMAFEKGQDPNDHYWIYFTTVGGQDVVLDCGLFVFNHPIFVVPFPHYAKYIPSSWPGITTLGVPAYFPPREAIKRGVLPRVHDERQRFSVLRDEGLKEAIRFSHDGFRPTDEEAITNFMERVAGHACEEIEEAIAIKWCEEACEVVGKNLQNREYLNYPKTDEVGHAVSEDPGDREQSALVPANELDEGWMKCLKKWNGKHRRGDINEQQLREALQAYKAKDQRRKRQ
ncbi:hypothetical protein H1R20_g12480, partial [Candolleomyces eurysporus]